MLLPDCYYDKSNAQKLALSKSIKKPKVTKEMAYIKALKKKVEKWEDKNKPRILRDAFNSQVNDANRNDQSVKGGFLNFHISTEPKLLSDLDGSRDTKVILSYIYSSLLYRDKETFEYQLSLARQYRVEDIVWLKGKTSNNIYQEKGDNNYIIGEIIDIQWQDYEQTKVDHIKIKVANKEKLISSDQLRYKVDKKDNYSRAFDKGVIFTFHLRKDVKWHDGKSFTADDVLFTIETLKNEYIAQLASLRNYYQPLKHWQKLDNYTVKFFLDKQYFKAIDFVGRFEVWPKHLFIPAEKLVFAKSKEFAEHFIKHKAHFAPVGTGQYYLPSQNIPNKKQEIGWKKNDYIMLLRNDNYFNKNRKGNLKKIYFNSIPSIETAFTVLNNGNLDFMESTSDQFFENTNSKKFKAKYVKAYYYVGGFSYIGYNMKRIYFKDRRVRTAITMLLDRETIINDIYYGLGIIVSGGQYYFGPAYNHKVKPYKYNPEQAIKLLNEAGWIDTDGDGIRDKDGVPFDVELVYPEGSITTQRIFAFLYEELSSVGIKIRLKRLEWTVFLDHLQDRKFDLCILGWATPIESDDYQIWHSSQWANQGSNHVGFMNKDADKMLEKTRITLDNKKRREIFFRFHELLHREQPYLFLFTSPRKAVYANRFRGVKFYRGKPGFDLAEWYIPKNLQTKEELAAENE